VTPEEIDRAKALFFDAIDAYEEEDPYACGYFDRRSGVLDGHIDEIMPALLAYGWTPPNVAPLPQPEREAPVETWGGTPDGPLSEGDLVTVNLGGKTELFKVAYTKGSSLTPGLTKLECTRVDGTEDTSVELKETT
jgi:hypothetical protein